MKKKSRLQAIPKQLWLLFSFLAAMVVWYLLSINPQTARSFPNVVLTVESVKTMIGRGVFFTDISSSLISVSVGFLLGFVLSLPTAILMAWYAPVRNIIEPWIQFIRNIPPLAYVPLVVISAGVGRRPQIIVITIATFLIMTVTIYQGVVNVDETLIKAARVLGATDKDIFFRVIAPATLPFIITAIRLGSSTALTTLIAAESTGAVAGLGMRIRSLNNSFESAPMLMYIIIIGIIGMLVEKLVKLNRTAKVVKGGRRFSFSALTVVGDQNGHVGYGFGKANDVSQAIKKSIEKAKANMIYIPLKNGTIPHEVQAKFKGSSVLLRPARSGTGIIAGGTIRAIMEAAGAANVLSKSLGSNSAVNVVRATFEAASELMDAKTIAKNRGKSITDVWG